MKVEKGTSKIIYFLEIPMMIYNRDSNAGFCNNLKLVFIQTLAISPIFNLGYLVHGEAKAQFISVVCNVQ
jgi:hypothetical protein